MNVKQLVTDSQEQRGGLERRFLLSPLALPVCSMCTNVELALPVCGVCTDVELAPPVCGVCTDAEPSTGAGIAFQGPHP